MKMSKINLKGNEILYIGYFNNCGKEIVNFNHIQKLSGWAFEHMKETNPNIKVVKVKDGYATEFASKYVN